MIDVSKVNWQAFKEDLQLLKKNEHLWAYASFGSREKNIWKRKKELKMK